MKCCRQMRLQEDTESHVRDLLPPRTPGRPVRRFSKDWMEKFLISPDSNGAPGLLKSACCSYWRPPHWIMQHRSPSACLVSPTMFHLLSDLLVSLQPCRIISLYFPLLRYSISHLNVTAKTFSLSPAALASCPGPLKLSHVPLCA